MFIIKRKASTTSSARISEALKNCLLRALDSNHQGNIIITRLSRTCYVAPPESSRMLRPFPGKNTVESDKNFFVEYSSAVLLISTNKKPSLRPSAFQSKMNFLKWSLLLTFHSISRDFWNKDYFQPLHCIAWSVTILYEKEIPLVYSLIALLVQWFPSYTNAFILTTLSYFKVARNRVKKKT